MVVFNTLMMIFVMLIFVNIILIFSLWRGTKSKYFGFLLLHWISLLLTFSVQRLLAQEDPLIRILTSLLPNFLSHFSLVWVLALLLNIKLPLKKCMMLPFITAGVIYFVHTLDVASNWLTMPMVMVHSSLYFYIVYQAYRHHRSQLTFSIKAICVLFVTYGIHLYDYVYFFSRMELLAYGFAIALALVMGIAILFPAAIIELMARENTRLMTEMEFKAKLTHSAKMVALGEMAGGVGHEINNPLAILSLSLGRLNKVIEKEDQVKLAPLIEKMAPLIETSQMMATRMSKIVRGLLVFSREDSEANYSPVAADELIQETLLLCSEKMKHNRVELSVALPAHPLIFMGNKVQISQVLLNLLNNASDAVEDLETRWIKVEVKELAQHLEFSVTDSGKGIAKEIQEKIFQPFFTTKDIGKGTGLGLSISRGIVENHKGSMRLDASSPHTRVIFTLPKVQVTS